MKVSADLLNDHFPAAGWLESLRRYVRREGWRDKRERKEGETKLGFIETRCDDEALEQKNSEYTWSKNSYPCPPTERTIPDTHVLYVYI